METFYVASKVVRFKCSCDFHEKEGQILQAGRIQCPQCSRVYEFARGLWHPTDEPPEPKLTLVDARKDRGRFYRESHSPRGECFHDGSLDCEGGPSTGMPS